MPKLRTNTTLSKIRKDGRASIIIRATFNGRVDLYSGYNIKPNLWNSSRQRVKQGAKVDGIPYNIINSSLDNMEDFCIEYVNATLARNEVPSVEELKRKMAKGWGQDMITVFNRLKLKLQAYNPKMTFDSLSTSTMDGFKVELAKTMYNDAIEKHLSYFKQFVDWARDKNYRINPEYYSYKPKLPKAKKDVRYLTLEELNTIYTLDLSHNEALDKVRDIFVFQCYTALRYSDVAQLKRENIKVSKDGNYEIDILTEKDDDRISFRLPQRAVAIYKKYQDYAYEEDRAFPVISNQKYNERLKELGEVADLKGEWIDYEYRLNEKIVIRIPKKDLTSHTARRTFVVSALNEGVSAELISAITSHSVVASMKPYVKANKRGTDIVIDAINKVSGD